VLSPSSYRTLYPNRQALTKILCTAFTSPSLPAARLLRASSTARCFRWSIRSFLDRTVFPRLKFHLIAPHIQPADGLGHRRQEYRHHDEAEQHETDDDDGRNFHQR